MDNQQSSPPPSSPDHAIGDKDIMRAAYLAKLRISQQELELLRPQLQNILNMIGEMNRVSTASIPPMFHTGETILRLREDTVTEVDSSAVLLALSTHTDDGLYWVPQIIP